LIGRYLGVTLIVDPIVAGFIRQFLFNHLVSIFLPRGNIKLVVGVFIFLLGVAEGKRERLVIG
jgi:hypothetical protein